MGSWYSEMLNAVVKKLADHLDATPFLCGIIIFGILLLIFGFVTAFAGLFITIGIIGLVVQKSYREAILRFDKAKKKVEEIETHDFKHFSYGMHPIPGVNGYWTHKPERFEVCGMIFKGHKSYPHPITGKVFQRVEGPFCCECKAFPDVRGDPMKIALFPFAFRYKFPCGHSKYFFKETPYSIFSDAKRVWLAGAAKIIED